MAYRSIQFFTDLPGSVIDELVEDLQFKYDPVTKDSLLLNDSNNKKIRNAKNAWIPTEHWVSGFLWHYISVANRMNFQYDLTCIDCEMLQYTVYEEGQFYGWHLDSGLGNQFDFPTPIDSLRPDPTPHVSRSTEYVRKLSFSLQLSSPDDYEGGNLQLMDEQNKTYFAPRNKGSLILFDSRTPHRVCKVKKGVRKSIVGWVVGPRWK